MKTLKPQSRKAILSEMKSVKLGSYGWVVDAYDAIAKAYALMKKDLGPSDPNTKKMAKYTKLSWEDPSNERAFVEGFKALQSLMADTAVSGSVLSAKLQGSAKLRAKFLNIVKAASKEAIKELEKRHLADDLKLDKTHGGGYAPSAEVLGARERARQKMEVDTLGKKLWDKQFASEHDGDKGVWVTYRDNSDKRIWQAQMDMFGDLLKDLGLKLKGNVVSYDQKRVKAAMDAHPAYIKLLAKKGSKGAQKMLKDGEVKAAAPLAPKGSTRKLNNMERGHVQHALKTRKGRMLGPKYKVGDRVMYKNREYIVFDAQADQDFGLGMYLVSPDLKVMVDEAPADDVRKLRASVSAGMPPSAQTDAAGLKRLFSTAKPGETITFYYRKGNSRSSPLSARSLVVKSVDGNGKRLYLELGRKSPRTRGGDGPVLHLDGNRVHYQSSMMAHMVPVEGVSKGKAPMVKDDVAPTMPPAMANVAKAAKSIKVGDTLKLKREAQHLNGEIAMGGPGRSDGTLPEGTALKVTKVDSDGVMVEHKGKKLKLKQGLLSRLTAGAPMSKIKKKVAPHMYVLSKDGAGGYLKSSPPKELARLGASVVSGAAALKPNGNPTGMAGKPKFDGTKLHLGSDVFDVTAWNPSSPEFTGTPAHLVPPYALESKRWKLVLYPWDPKVKKSLDGSSMFYVWDVLKKKTPTKFKNVAVFDRGDRLEIGTLTAASTVQAAKDTGDSKKDKSRKAVLADLLAKATAMSEAVDMNGFPEVKRACDAVTSLSELETELNETAIKLKAAKPKTEEAEQYQARLNELRNNIDAMMAPLKATMDSMEAMVLATAALEEQFNAVTEEVAAMEEKLKNDKARLSTIAKAVETTAKIK